MHPFDVGNSDRQAHRPIDKAQATPQWQQFVRTNMQTPVHRTNSRMRARVHDEVTTRRAFLKSIGAAR